MIFSRDYSRAILNLKQDEDLSSADKYSIFGRVVIEIKNGRGEVMLYAKGIDRENSGSLYLICRRNESFIPLKAVLVNITGGAAALKWRFNPDNISGSGLKIEDVSVIVLVGGEGKPLLSAFCGKPVKWDKEGLLHLSAAKSVSGESVAAAAEAVKAEIKQEKPKAEKEEAAVPDETRKTKNEKKVLDERVRRFTEVVNHFRKDLDELRRYAYMEKADREEEQAEGNLPLDLEFIFSRRPKYDFEGSSGDFRKIGLNDLCLVDDYMYKYANNPTVRAACRKYNHLLLGRSGDGELLFCVPDENRELKEAELLGFGEFRETDKNFGYRIMRIAKEKESNENPKEKLDGRGA